MTTRHTNDTISTLSHIQNDSNVYSHFIKQTSVTHYFFAVHLKSKQAELIARNDANA